MLYIVRKVRNEECWRILNAKTGAVHTKCSTLANAKKQATLLNQLDHRNFAHKK